jgi:hypothetical protein
VRRVVDVGAKIGEAVDDLMKQIAAADSFASCDEEVVSVVVGSIRVVVGSDTVAELDVKKLVDDHIEG